MRSSSSRQAAATTPSASALIGPTPSAWARIGKSARWRRNALAPAFDGRSGEVSGDSLPLPNNGRADIRVISGDARPDASPFTVAQRPGRAPVATRPGRWRQEHPALATMAGRRRRLATQPAPGRAPITLPPSLPSSSSRTVPTAAGGGTDRETCSPVDRPRRCRRTILRRNAPRELSGMGRAGSGRPAGVGSAAQREGRGRRCRE
jgi:hypothetical protein